MKYMNNLKKSIYILINSIYFFIILLFSFFSKRIFNYYWNKYYTNNTINNKTIFNLCVQWLLYISNKTNLTYEQLNVIIFCVIWPVVTILSIFGNILLIIF